MSFASLANLRPPQARAGSARLRWWRVDLVLACSRLVGGADAGRGGEQSEAAARCKPPCWSEDTNGIDNLSLDPYCRFRGSRWVGIRPQTQSAFREGRQDPFRRREGLRVGRQSHLRTYRKCPEDQIPPTSLDNLRIRLIHRKSTQGVAAGQFLSDLSTNGANRAPRVTDHSDQSPNLR